MKIPDELSSSTATWLSIEEVAIHADMPSTSSTSNIGASPAIDRHNPIIISDSRRAPITPPTIISSKPFLQHKLLKSPKSDSAKQVAAASLLKKKTFKDQKEKRKSPGKSVDFINNSCVMLSSSDQNLFTPPWSSRYLLGENMLPDALPDLSPVLETVIAESVKVLALETDEKASSPSSFLDSNFALSSPDKSCLPSNEKSEQVVTLRVSLHCKGCAAKVRKHISRMEGVTYFNIDFAAKKVTVVGDVTLLTVLATISKVKNAQLWTPDTPVWSRIPG